jgi:hypothetical protein
LIEVLVVNKVVTVALFAGLVVGWGAVALAREAGQTAKTPDSWSYDLKNGQRVPKANRVANNDGSWTEQIRQGNCTVTRTGREGEVREERKCD